MPTRRAMLSAALIAAVAVTERREPRTSEITGWTDHFVRSVRAARPTGAADTERIVLGRVPPGAQHAITLDEIVGLREVLEPRLSPDGHRIAFLVRQAFRDCNCSRTALYVASADLEATVVGATADRVGDSARPTPSKLVEETALSNLRWTPDGRAVSYLLSRGGDQAVWLVSAEGSKPRAVWRHIPEQAVAEGGQATATGDTLRSGVLQYEWSPDGRRIAFTALGRADIGRAAGSPETGIVYDDRRMTNFDLLNQAWNHPATELWIYDVDSLRERRLWRAPEITSVPWAYGVFSFGWSPDGLTLAVAYQAERGDNWSISVRQEVGVVAAADGRFTRLVGAVHESDEMPAWSPDGSRLAFSARRDHNASRFAIVDVATRALRYVPGSGVFSGGVTRLWWQSDGEGLVAAVESPGRSWRERAGVYHVALADGAMGRLTPAVDRVANCDVGIGGRTACVREEPSIPPDPAIVDLTTGKVSVAASVNPELARVALSPVTELRWANRFGAWTNGYLIKPAAHVAGRRYPLVVILYGFSGEFVTQAGWIPNYPAQVFASEGFAVLMANGTRYADWKGNDFVRGSKAEAYSPLASFEAGVRLLTRQGLVDSTRVGLMGISHGGYWTEFAITHSTIFRVASVANDGDFSPGVYWLLGDEAHRDYYEHFLGGPPSGSTLANWQAVAPALNVARVRAPVLMEAAGDEAPDALEMLTALRRAGVPSELVIYPNDVHVMTQPSHRLASMQRNLEWFEYWLQHREDPEPARGPQYGRWRVMKTQAEKWAPK